MRHVGSVVRELEVGTLMFQGCVSEVIVSTVWFSAKASVQPTIQPQEKDLNYAVMASPTAHVTPPTLSALQ